MVKGCGWMVIVAALVPAATLAGNVGFPFTDVVDAARRGDEHAVRALLERSPECVFAKDGEGYTALHWAAIRGHGRMVSLLLEAGAAVDVSGADGGTPLHWACHVDDAGSVARLLDCGADPGVANRWGRTPLHVAIRRGCAAVAALLLERGADPNAPTREGWTPLHVAYLSGRPELAALLLAAGADPGRRDADGSLPVECERPRPPTVAATPSSWEELIGRYDLGGGAIVSVWREGDRLFLREYARDELEPVGPDEFICRAEPWRVRFVRGEGGAVDAVVIDFLRRKVRGERMEAPRYVGSRACKACHIRGSGGGEYVRWLKSRHAHAYWRLAGDWALFLAHLRPQNRDVESPIGDDRCLLCHLTGAQDESPLRESTFRREEGVGCESCHGPGSEYMAPQVMADRESFLAHGGRIPGEATCRTCHRRADGFDFETAWRQIAHGHPRPQPEG